LNVGDFGDVGSLLSGLGGGFNESLSSDKFDVDSGSEYISVNACKTSSSKDEDGSLF
jgi:hypothetical protein